MPRDAKYGRIDMPDATWSDIGDDEVVVVFRAKDQNLLPLMAHYRLLCQAVGSPPHHIDRIDKSIYEIRSWQENHGARVPTSNNWLARPQ